MMDKKYRKMADLWVRSIEVYDDDDDGIGEVRVGIYVRIHELEKEIVRQRSAENGKKPRWSVGLSAIVNTSLFVDADNETEAVEKARAIVMANIAENGQKNELALRWDLFDHLKPSELNYEACYRVDENGKEVK